jgi:cytidylate kinase
LIIAIDGPAGSGKSTIAKLVAEKTGCLFLNSGSFYRGITLKAIEAVSDPSGEKAPSSTPVATDSGTFSPSGSETVPTLIDSQSLIKLAAGLTIEYTGERLHINGEDVEDLLHSDAVDAWVSQVSAVPEVRDIVNVNLKKNAAKRNVVCEGRDRCTVVFPDAEYQFYLDASIEVQVLRRFKQGVSGLTLDEIRASIRERDERDKNKAVGALKIAENATYIDTSHLTIVEVCDIILGKITLKE